MSTPIALRFTADERSQWERDGFVVRTSIFDDDEIDELRAVVESVAATVAGHARRAGAGPEAKLGDGHRIQFSSRAAIQWEWDDGSNEIRLVEPCDHLHARLATLFDDPRVQEPMKDAVGSEPTSLFTSKLNMKRAVEGSEFPYHQDYPYWYVAIGTDAADVATAVLFLDDATTDNGALRVVAGSHRFGPARRDPRDPTGFLADARSLDVARELTLELPAGSVVFFGAFLVHRSSPNRSSRHRRALLPSFQPAGRPRLRDVPYRRELVAELP
jgi:ectoine hydroxylase-related dioxygenase (phytanoyl-CoA dioxygenase family)